MAAKHFTVIVALVGIALVSTLLYSKQISCSLTFEISPEEEMLMPDNGLQENHLLHQQITRSNRERSDELFDWEANSRRVGEWREKLVEALEGGNNQESQEARDAAFETKTIFPCENTFLDLGSNVGDTLRKLIDAGLPPVSGVQYMFDASIGRMGSNYYGQPRPGAYGPATYTLPKYIQRKMDGRHPEDFCFYGVEGNPHFTPLLKDIEIKTMNLDPRPVRHVHFFTEHIGTGKDGPATLYLDTVNKGDNFWGSSIYQSHWDVVKSGKDTGVKVTGITLTTLIKKTIKPNGHAIVKIDIEGAEYPLMEEALKSGVLCEFCREKNVTMAMVLEHHPDDMMGGPELREHWEEIKGEQQIRDCGVDLHYGDMDT